MFDTELRMHKYFEDFLKKKFVIKILIIYMKLIICMEFLIMFYLKKPKKI